MLLGCWPSSYSTNRSRAPLRGSPTAVSPSAGRRRRRGGGLDTEGENDDVLNGSASSFVPAFQAPPPLHPCALRGEEDDVAAVEWEEKARGVAARRQDGGKEKAHRGEWRRRGAKGGEPALPSCVEDDGAGGMEMAAYIRGDLKWSSCGHRARRSFRRRSSCGRRARRSFRRQRPLPPSKLVRPPRRPPPLPCSCTALAPSLPTAPAPADIVGGAPAPVAAGSGHPRADPVVRGKGIGGATSLLTQIKTD